MTNQLENMSYAARPTFSAVRKRIHSPKNQLVGAPHREKWVVCIFFICLLSYNGSSLYCNNISVSNVSLTGQNTASDYTFVKFDIGWENSWRVSTGPSNWDAAWVFVKFRKQGQAIWNHATLNTSGHTEPANSTISTPSDGKGIFIYRSADMAQGSVSYPAVRLRWNYGVDGLSDDDKVEVCVFAIEMVNVPTGSFYVGHGHFRLGTTSANPFPVTSEGEITLGGGGATSLGNGDATYQDATAKDDFSNTIAKTLPASYPKGYNGYYCMKYEITQEQYVAFLNTLTYTQQKSRTTNSPNNNPGVGALINANQYRCGIDIMTKGIASTTPAVYACNLDGDAIYNENVDGQDIACNYLNWADVTAYLDWAALRPMTELEFEKACRGINQPTYTSEIACGNTSIVQATGISNSGCNNETASNAEANIATNSHTNVQGPLRVGSFGQGVNTRAATGAGYYGAMELSGNLYEVTVTVGNSTGRAFTGTHGNGTLDATGNADAGSWPGTNAIGSGLRGGAWANFGYHCYVYYRTYATYAYTPRSNNRGGRGVRTAP